MSSVIKVLVINNDKRLITNISNYLATSGMTVYKINSSNKLNEKIKKISPNILLLDCNIVPINAFEICRKHKDDFPIILTKLGNFSANTIAQEKKWATMQGAKTLLYLPCGGEYLVRLVKDIVKDYKEGY